MSLPIKLEAFERWYELSVGVDVKERTNLKLLYDSYCKYVSDVEQIIPYKKKYFSRILKARLKPFIECGKVNITYNSNTILEGIVCTTINKE